MKKNSEQLWLNLWKQINARGNPQEVYKDLVARYSESHRAYHTLKHIGPCLNEFESIRHLLMNPDTVEFALWYHDSVYDPRAKDNEEKSATLAMEVVRNALLPDNFGLNVSNLILATKHSEIPNNTDTQIFIDIDLSILGQPKKVFDEYEKQIRNEYSWISEEMFAIGRSEILKSFLKRPSVYLTHFFRDKYELQARQNITRSLLQLSNRS